MVLAAHKQGHANCTDLLLPPEGRGAPKAVVVGSVRLQSERKRTDVGQHERGVTDVYDICFSGLLPRS